VLETAVLALHVLAATCWFGPKLFWARRVRAIVAGSKDSLSRELNFTAASALVVIATGLGLIFIHGGFRAVNPRIHAGLGLTLAAFFAMLALEVPAIAKIRAAQDRGAPAEAGEQVKKIVMGVMIEHTCWLVTLVLMVWRVPPG
jgi:uncharacterized membrane protein